MLQPSLDPALADLQEQVSLTPGMGWQPRMALLNAVM